MLIIHVIIITNIYLYNIYSIHSAICPRSVALCGCVQVTWAHVRGSNSAASLDLQTSALLGRRVRVGVRCIARLSSMPSLSRLGVDSRCSSQLYVATWLIAISVVAIAYLYHKS